MNELVREWIAKAEGDYATATRELGAANSPNYDAACYHAQQCIEKLMKGLLTNLAASPPKTHDLVHLGQLLVAVCPEWSWPVEELRFVSRAAVMSRYPGEAAEHKDAEETLELAGRMRTELLSLLDPQG